MSSIRCIVPPYILRNIIEHGDDKERNWARRTLDQSETFKALRLALSPPSVMKAEPRRYVYDSRATTDLPGVLRRQEGDERSNDAAVDEAYDALGATYDLFHEAFSRHSLDDAGLRLDATVHYGRAYDNAFWNGTQMVFGDGDGRLFNRFTIAPEIVGHELAHGVTQHEARLRYRGEPGALNESFSDVLGVLVKQRMTHVEARRAAWLIGEGLFTKNVRGVAIRSMKDPGSAYDDPVLGKDPQPATMKEYVQTEDDEGGVHINSGIPNRAFYLAAISIGGFAWEKAGRIWYVALRDRLRQTSTFNRAAAVTAAAAADLFGKGSLEQQAVVTAWRAVGIDARIAAVSGTLPPPSQFRVEG